MRDEHSAAADATRAIEDLLRWAARTSRDGYDALPSRIVEKAAAIISDDVASMIAAGAEDEVKAIRAAAAARAPRGGSTVVGAPGLKVSPEWAAAANVIAGNWLELDGGYRLATCHGSLYTLPSALAELEASGGTMGDVIVALVVSYEVVTRVARAYRPPLPLAAHPHATLSPLGAAAAIAAARRLDETDFAATVLAGATLSLNGPFSHAKQGATVRNAWAGAGARLGFFAADMVAAGLSSSGTAVHDVFATSYGYPEDVAALTDGLGERFAVEDGYHKLYACCQYLHSSVEAAHHLAAVALTSSDPSDIDEILVETHPLAAALDTIAPSSLLAGKFSLPHAVAAVLVEGSTAPETFSGARLHDPRIAELREKVRIRVWDPVPAPPEDRPAKVTVTLRDGSVHEQTVLSAIGGPDRPLSPADLITKIQTITGSEYPRFAPEARGFITGPATVQDAPVSEFLSKLTSRG